MDMTATANKIEILRDWIASSRNIVAFTGAGCSTESGLPSFRGAGGLFEKMGTNITISTEMVLLVPIFK
jgi:NAD-dependent deacetylase